MSHEVLLNTIATSSGVYVQTTGPVDERFLATIETAVDDIRAGRDPHSRYNVAPPRSILETPTEIEETANS